jgi:hypothetical protein
VSDNRRDADVAAAMDAKPVIDALWRLADEHRTNQFPCPWQAAVHHSHLPIPECVRLLQQRANHESTAPSRLPAVGNN